MYMGKIEAAVAVPAEAEAPAHRGAALIGALYLIVALPWFAARLLGHFVMRDIRLAGHALRVCGEIVIAARR